MFGLGRHFYFQNNDLTIIKTASMDSLTLNTHIYKHQNRHLRLNDIAVDHHIGRHLEFPKYKQIL